MGKHTTFTQDKSPKKSREPHEIWKNFGCLMMLILPAISFASSYETVHWLVDNSYKIIPRSLLGKPQLPALVHKSDGLMTILSPIAKVEHLYAIVILGILYMVVISGLISVIYAAAYGMVAPSRYGPTDAPPIKIKVTKKSR